MNQVKSREQYVEEAEAFMGQFNPVTIWPYFCTINVFRAMLSEVGLNRTLEAIRPYNEAWGRTVVGGMVKERLGPRETDLESVALGSYYAHSCTSLGHVTPLEIYEGGATYELYVCPNPRMKAPPEMCIAMSHIMTESGCKAIDPEYEGIYTHHLGNGDDCCRLICKKKSSKFTIDHLGRLEKTVPRLELPMEEMLSFNWGMVVMRQIVTFTCALIDLVGSQRALDLVVPPARETGLEIGTILKGGGAKKGDLSTIKDELDLLGSIAQQRGSPSIMSGSVIEKEITDCPFKGAPPEVCYQFEAVFNGVCEAINPDCEFAFDRMMSKGDPSCHWVVRKRTESVKGEAEKDTPIEDPARMLALRFAKGEISHEEFDKSMELLKKHQVVR